MKKLLIVLLCLCIVLTGCHKGEKQSSTSSNNKITDRAGDREKDNTLENQLLTLNTEWSLAQSLDTITTKYEAPVYEAKVPAYKIAKDLSNIENIKQFSGFSKDQIKLLSQNGFVVIPSNNTRSYYTYDNNEYNGVPNFITSDCALHLFHQFYDKSLMFIESSYLYKDLDQMTAQMLDKSILLLKELKEEDLKKLQEQNIIYFLVARMLFTQSENISADIDQKLLTNAKQEYELCQAANGIQRSPLFDKDYDYSQFTVRGHYTRSEELSKYFKTMMWLGTAPYAFEEDGKLLYDNIYRSLLISFTTFSESDGNCDAKLWSDIYQPTSQYVGISDDINVFDMNGLRRSVFGDSENPNIFNDDKFRDKIKEAVEKLPDPRIKADFDNLSTPTGKQFRFMGQRYVLDGEILQKLIHNNKRPIPSSLDVMGVLGNSTAQELLFNVYQPQKSWPQYTDQYNKLKEKVSAYHTDDWKTNLYSGWLWTLKDLTTDYSSNSGMPFFMTTKAWKYKSLNAALGSYTELKHDTVLYAKQSSAEGGGPEAFADQHYVEPDISLYSKLLYLTNSTISILKDKGMINENLLEGAESYKKLLNLLLECSSKELKNEPLNKDEKKQLLWVGSTMENIVLNFQLGASQDFDTPNDITDMLVTDISTYKATYLTLGTGFFDDIYVVVPVENKLYLSRGTVYSFYEFTSDKRLTDKEWWGLNGIKVTHREYGDTMDFGEPSSSRPKQPDWTKYFKNGSDNVNIEPLEVDWDNMSE